MPNNATASAATHASHALVQTRSGLVQGRLLPPANGWTSLQVFLGIPYAAAPVGPLRWRPPQALQPWSGVRPALAFGPDLPQAPNARLHASGQSEDCLYLNVWAPAGAAPGSLPVMAWFHGGGFVGGSGSDMRSDGAAMAAQGAVMVSFNYRSGLFGFLAHPSLSQESADAVSGNYGLMDQIAALQWVQANIAAFGGDPQRVTAFGVSAGSASISLLLCAGLSRGLMHRAILHSPGAARPLATLADAERAGLALGPDIAALRDLSAQDLFAKTGLLAPKVRGLTTPRVLRPIRDGVLLPEDERPALLGGRMHALPLIVGSNADEGTLLTASWPIDTLADYEAMVNANFGAAAAQARSLYPAMQDADARARVAEMFADTQFNYGTRLLAQCMAQHERRTWRYLFLRRRPTQHDGPHHGEEVAHVFGNLGAVPAGTQADFDQTDEQMSGAMQRAWFAFANHADPNGPGLATWPRYDTTLDNHLAFADSIDTGQGWRKAQLDFLERFYAAGSA